MKRNKRATTTNKKVALIVAAVLVIFGALGFFLYTTWAQTNRGATTESSEDSTRGLEESVGTNPDDKQTPPNTDSPDPIQQSDSNKRANVQMIISVTVSGDVIYIRGGINASGISNGTCYALITNTDGVTVQKNTELLQNPSTTDCETITVNKRELGAGTWKVTLHYTSDYIKGVSNEVSVEI
jgi:hypothetical protein